jgi:hypothetical protein
MVELAHLSGFVLGGGRDARIAVNHAAIAHLKICIKKLNAIKAVPVMEKFGRIQRWGDLATKFAWNGAGFRAQCSSLQLDRMI